MSGRLRVLASRKIRAPIKINRHSPPPQNPKYPPPLKRGILWTWFFLQNGRIFPGVHKIGAAISGPRIADKNFTDTRIFLNAVILLKTRRRCDFSASHHKHSAIFLAIYLQFLQQNLRFALCDLKMQRFFRACDSWGTQSSEYVPSSSQESITPIFGLGKSPLP